MVITSNHRVKAMTRTHYVANYTKEQIEALIIETEDRLSRAETTEACIADYYTLQELEAALQINQGKGL